jgi:hypothetical protein
MNKDDIIRMAREAGFFVKDAEVYSPSVQYDHELTPCFERFANLVAAQEREACAKVCEERGMVKGGEVFATRIRARGTT